MSCHTLFWTGWDKNLMREFLVKLKCFGKCAKTFDLEIDIENGEREENWKQSLNKLILVERWEVNKKIKQVFVFKVLKT